ncbi:MAG: tetratricopeptide repeat protein [Acidobacteria bacterium]|nr:tetratricopeptide repeat protein [Acidobacteriota bacterium]
MRSFSPRQLGNKTRGRFLLAVQVIAILLTAAIPLRATLSAEEEQAFDHFYNLEYDQAIVLFERLRDADRNNPLHHNRVAMAYLYKQLYIAGALHGDLFSVSNKFFRTKKIEPDPALAKKFWEANQSAIRICEQRLKKNKQDQEALYACGVAYATNASYQGLIDRSLLDSMGSARKANDYHARLLRLNPRFYDAYLVPGIYDFVIGSLPGPLKVLLFFVGVSGDKQRGIQFAETVAQAGERAQHDAKIILTVMYRREKRFADARRTVTGLANDFPRNYILPLEIASIYRAADQVESAIQGYENVLEEIRQGRPGFAAAPEARIHFELGELYRKMGDLESARQHLQQVAGSRGSTPELEEESAAVRQQIEEALQQKLAGRGQANLSGSVPRP